MAGQAEILISRHNSGKKNSRVCMPHFDKSELQVIEEDGSVVLTSRWNLIQEELNFLRNLIINNMTEDHPDFGCYSIPQAIEDCILTYNPDLECNFGILKETLAQMKEKAALDSSIIESEFTLVFMIDCVLSLPELFPKPVKLLKGEEASELVTLSKDQACCILASAFFCTFPNREANRTKYLEYPRINFTMLFNDHTDVPGFDSDWQADFRQAKVEKLKCILNYFWRMKYVFGKPTGLPAIIYERRSLPPQDIPDWASCSQPLIPIHVLTSGVIKNSVGILQVDSAHKFVGGGTLGNGAGKEEIRFSTCPELICAQLFTKLLGPLDTLLIHRYEWFSLYNGHGSKFRYLGSFNENKGSVLGNRLVCLDAHEFPKDSLRMQLEKKGIDRELNKCFLAFKNGNSNGIPEVVNNGNRDTIASWKWGCGVFNGDPLLKSMIQWMAASYCGKRLILDTYQDPQLTNDLEQVQYFAKMRNCSVGDMYEVLLKAHDANVTDNLLEFVKLRLSEEPTMRFSAELNNNIENQVDQKITGKIKTKSEEPVTPISMSKHKNALEKASTSNLFWKLIWIFLVGMAAYLYNVTVDKREV